jgi:hypothetical protein
MGSSRLREDAAVAAGAVSVAALAWRFHGVTRVTVIAKATFAFAPDAEMPRVAPDPIVRAEVHHDNNPTQSVRLTTDCVPYLAHADVVLTGYAHAPRGVFLETLPVRLGLFDGAHPVLDKTVLVRKPGGIKEVPLVYERAYGGIGWPDNPFGKGALPGSGEPTLFDPDDPQRLAGFGPIGRAWPARRRLLGALPRPPSESPGVMELPEGFDWAYFQAAPVDQRVPFLRGGEWIVMDGMHRKIPRLRVRLPAARALALVYGLGPWGVAEGQPLALHADVLRIDADARRSSLTFRAAFPVADAAALDAVRVVLGVELPGQPITWPDPASLVGPASSAEAAQPPPSSDMPRSVDNFESVHGEVLLGTMSGAELDEPRGAEPRAPIEPVAPPAPGAPRREPVLDTLASTVHGEPPAPRSTALPFRGGAATQSAMRQATGRRWRPPVENPLSGTHSQTPEETARAAQRTALPFGGKERPLPAPPVPEPPLPAAPVPAPASADTAASPRVTASPWAPAPPPAPPVRTPSVPPPQGPPVASPALKKGLYGRFGGKR